MNKLYKSLVRTEFLNTMVIIEQLLKDKTEEVAIAIYNQATGEIMIEGNSIRNTVEFRVDGRAVCPGIRNYEVLRLISLALRPKGLKLYISDSDTPYRILALPSTVSNFQRDYHLPREEMKGFDNPLKDERSLLISSGVLGK